MNGASGWRMMVLAALVCAGHSAAQDAEGLWIKAQESYDEFTWDRAIAGFEQFVAKFPGDARVPEAKFKILHARYRLERYDEFEAALTAFCEEYRRTVWGARGRELLAQHLFRSQRWSNWERIGTLYAEALRDYRSAVGRRPFTADEKKTYIQMLFGAAEFYSQWYAERSRELAEEHLRSIIQYNLDPETTAKAWVRLGDLQRGRLEQADKAEESWLKVVREYATTSFADDALWRLADLDYDRSNYVRCRARLILLRQKYPKSDLEDNAKQRIAEIEAPRLSLQLSQTHLPGANIPARLIARNLKGVRFTVWRLDLLAAIQKVGLDLSAASDLTKLGEQVGTWRQDVKDAGDYQYVESKFDAPLKGPGVFVVEAVAEGRRGVTDHALVNITSLVLVQQLAAQKLVNYVASGADRQPVAGVELTVLRRPNKNAVRPVLQGTTNAESWTLSYDEDNRTTRIRCEEGVLLTKTITNHYDAMGRRVAKTMDGQETRYVLDLAGKMERILCDTARNGAITAWYVHGPDLAFKVDPAGGLTCYHADAQGNIIALTDTNAANLAQYAYTPYGRTLASTNLLSQIANPYLFVGSQGVMEDLPGLFFMRARYYSADSGVFLSTDPEQSIGPQGQPEAYLYCGDSPLASIDPSGYWGEDVHNIYFEEDVENNPVLNSQDHFRGDIDVIQKELQAAIDEGDWERFKALMHQGQDYFAHYDQGYRAFGPEEQLGECRNEIANTCIGHLKDSLSGKNPDEPENSPEAYKKTVAFTKQWESEWNKDPDRSAVMLKEKSLHEATKKAVLYATFRNDEVLYFSEQSVKAVISVEENAARTVKSVSTAWQSVKSKITDTARSSYFKATSYLNTAKISIRSTMSRLKSFFRR